MTPKADAPARNGHAQLRLGPALADFDPEIAAVVRNEERRQNEGLEVRVPGNISD